MALKLKRQSMAEALGRSGEVAAFLREGDPIGENPGKACRHDPPKSRERQAEARIAVTLRLPRDIAHGLIDASAERRKNREPAWGQQDIATEAIEAWLSKHFK